MRIKNILEDIAKTGTINNQIKYYKLVDFSFGDSNFNKSSDLERENKNFNNTIYRLKKQGFIKKINKDGSILWKITRLGIKKLKLLTEKIIVPKKTYLKVIQNYTIIIAFDIPEELAYLRQWLRYALIDLGFQKSLWVGKIKLPEEFIKDIYKLKIDNFIAVFKVIEQGLL